MNSYRFIPFIQLLNVYQLSDRLVLSTGNQSDKGSEQLADEHKYHADCVIQSLSCYQQVCDIRLGVRNQTSLKVYFHHEWL